MSRFVIVAPDGVHYFPFEGCRFLELPEHQDEHFDMDAYVKQYASSHGTLISASFDDGETVTS
jgi:hypothetical protein